MKSSLSDHSLIRQYLLGRLDDKHELENDLSEGILFGDELAAMADSIEDEIIEEYLDETLDTADKKSVEEYFLQPPERQAKLRFARLLRKHFDSRSDDRRESLGVTGNDPERTEVSPVVYGRSHFLAYGMFAALILMSILSLTFISGLRKRQALLEDQLSQERARSSSLAAQASLLQPPMIALTLVSDRSRAGGGQIPHIQIKPSTQRLMVEIALPGGASGAYDVRLESTGGRAPAWSARVSPLVSPTGDARLVFDVPTAGVESGVYSFAVSPAVPGSKGSKLYDFEIRLTR